MKTRLLAFLRQGIAPEELAFCIALGCVLGIFPVMGSTTLLCAFAAWLGRLNQPAIQAVNYLMYPVQIALLIPFYRLGEWIFRAPRLDITINSVRRLIASGGLNAIHVLWDTTWRAVMAWGILAPGVMALLYVILVLAFRRLRLLSLANVPAL